MHSVAYDKHPSRKVADFRHLLGCDTIGLHITFNMRERERAHSNQHSPILLAKQVVFCIICILDFIDQKLWGRLCLLRIRVALKE